MSDTLDNLDMDSLDTLELSLSPSMMDSTLGLKVLPSRSEFTYDFFDTKSIQISIQCVSINKYLKMLCFNRPNYSSRFCFAYYHSYDLF